MAEDESQILSHLYGAIDDHDQWQRFFSAAADTLHAEGASVTVVDPKQPHRSMMLDNFRSEADRHSYVNNYSQNDWHANLLEDTPVGCVAFGDRDWFRRTYAQDYANSQFFLEYAKQTCMWTTLGGPFLREDGLVGMLGFHRRSFRRADFFGAPDFAFVRGLMPHVNRAVQQAEYVSFLEMTNALLSRFNRHGLILIDDRGRVVYLSEAAARTFESQDLTLHDQQLTIRNPKAQKVVNRAIGSQLLHRHLANDRIIKVPRSGRSLPLFLRFSPNMRSRPFADAPDARIGVIVRVVDPGQDMDLAPALMQEALGFTQREVEVANCLVKGQKTRETAEHLGVSYQTLRTHLKNMRHKAGVSRQVELVSMCSVFVD